ncbi:hypothetical protein PV726_46340 [Streptomyces europaeiscabiei]|uniref:hypothetical protein n=1 Tax=Streptomyces europaeiscabiei TaxID=146819 RepID=UPI0029A29D29|nr:hypothetical protein [Streptomyces europaeiscabiei]MDX3697492.1 hypothetical protein [Streptomyces europaeiscabiei]
MSIVQRDGRVPVGSSRSSEVTTARHNKITQKVRVAGLGPHPQLPVPSGPAEAIPGMRANDVSPTTSTHAPAPGQVLRLGLALLCRHTHRLATPRSGLGL